MIQFKLVPHAIRGAEVEIVEVWVGSKMVAALYPELPNKVRLISNHLQDHTSVALPYAPAVHEFEFYPG